MRINFFVNNFLRGFRIGVNIPGAFLDEICKYSIVKLGRGWLGFQESGLFDFWELTFIFRVQGFIEKSLLNLTDRKFIFFRMIYFLRELKKKKEKFFPLEGIFLGAFLENFWYKNLHWERLFPKIQKIWLRCRIHFSNGNWSSPKWLSKKRALGAIVALKSRRQRLWKMAFLLTALPLNFTLSMVWGFKLSQFWESNL